MNSDLAFLHPILFRNVLRENRTRWAQNYYLSTFKYKIGYKYVQVRLINVQNTFKDARKVFSFVFLIFMLNQNDINKNTFIASFMELDSDPTYFNPILS